MAMQRGSDSCKIAVPVHRRLTDFEIAVVGHNLALLSEYQGVLFGPESKRPLLESTAKELQKSTGSSILVECFGDAYFTDVFGYSWLLLKREFYDRFDDVSHVLICQPDAFILSADLKKWLASGYSYLGAPVFVGFDKPTMPLEFSNFLNGGLSLRNIADARSALNHVTLVQKSNWTRGFRALGLLQAINAILRSFGKSIVVIPKNPHEDVVWTGPIANALEAFSIPGLETAAQFSFENMPRELFRRNGQRLPFGCHAFGVYDPEFWREHFPDWTHEYLSNSCTVVSESSPNEPDRGSRSN